MDDIRFTRHFRTPYSESYYIMQGIGMQTNNRLGTVDIHFTSTAVHGTLILERELEEADLSKLIEQIDEDLVLSADMPRDDFLVSVYVGKDVGFSAMSISQKRVTTALILMTTTSASCFLPLPSSSLIFQEA